MNIITFGDRKFIPQKSTHETDGVDDCSRCAFKPSAIKKKYKEVCAHAPCIQKKIYYIEIEQKDEKL